VTDPNHAFASWFLLASCAFFLVVYAVPLVLFPLRWARWFRWELPAGRADVTVYFARCTGLLALAILAVVVPAIRDPAGHRMVFDLIAWACGLMTLLHVWGAIRRTQPWPEHVEIVMYAAVCGAALWLRAALG